VDQDTLASGETPARDDERRRRRSIDPEIALQLQLQSVLDAQGVELLVIGDLEGAPLATAGDGDAAIELANFAAGVAKMHRSWQSMVTNQGFVVVQRVEIGVCTWVVAAQARFELPDRRGIARAVEGAMRILRDGVIIAGEAPVPLVKVGGWGEWGDDP
jgi:hypothetical protein